MDYFNRDIQRIKKRAEEQQLLPDISRGRSLDKMDALAALFNGVIVLHHLHSADAYYASPHFGKVMGTKPGASAYDCSDFNKAMYTACNVAHHTLFIAHFGNTSAQEHRTTYCFTAADGQPLWLNTCSQLINPGMGYNPFILTLLQGMDSMDPAYDRPIKVMPAPDELDAFKEIVDKFGNRETQALELIAAGADNQTGADEMDIHYNSFRDYRYDIKAKLGAPFNERIGLYFFVSKFNKTAGEDQHPTNVG